MTSKHFIILTTQLCAGVSYWDPQLVHGQERDFGGYNRQPFQQQGIMTLFFNDFDEMI